MQLTKRIYNGIAVGLITLLFVISIFVREENLKAPLSRHHEWITAHAMLTAELWDENGAATYKFSPVYTDKGSGNAYRNMLGGVTAENGDVYYVSYPPFAFIYLHAVSQLTGGPSLFSVRFASLSLHYIAALLLYFLFCNLKPDPERKHPHFGGLIAAALFVFAQGHLWFMGNLFFVDMMVIPLFLAGLLLTLKYYHGNYKSERLMLGALFLIFFLATYTEWLGLLSAFFTGITFLTLAIFKKERRFYRPFLLIALGSSLALTTTVVQYSSIEGWASLKAVSEKKYSERSGHETEVSSAVHFNIHKAESFEFMVDFFKENYKSLRSYAGYLLALFIAIIPLAIIQRKKLNRNTLWAGLLLTLIALLPILAHYLLFYNFNVLHDFSGLKTATFLMLVMGLFITAITAALKNLHKYAAFAAIGLITGLTYFKSAEAIELYKTNNPLSDIDWPRIESAEVMAETCPPDAALFSNTRLSPEQVYYAKHSISPIRPSDSTAIFNIMTMRRNDKAQYYHHEGSVLKAIVYIEKQADNLVFLDTLVIN
jgi:hypothetical protein